MRDFPRWLYRGEGLADGVIVRDEAQAADAEGKGYRDPDAAAQAQPTAGAPPAAPVAAAPVKRGPGRPRKDAAADEARVS